MPVLAICVVLAFAAVESLILSTGQRFNFFNTILTGAPATLALIALAILFAHLAIQLYRMRQYAWWVLLLLHLIGGALFIVSIVGQPFIGLTALTAVCWIAYLAFLFWLRQRYWRSLR